MPSIFLNLLSIITFWTHPCAVFFHITTVPTLSYYGETWVNKNKNFGKIKSVEVKSITIIERWTRLDAIQMKY
jgi:hypothetical protein